MESGHSKKEKLPRDADRNPDPITDAAGAHPVGVGVGAAAGGAVSGAMAGALAGPVGAAIGAAVGAVAGGYAGKAMAEAVDPTVEGMYWRDHYTTRPYYDSASGYEHYGPAYRYGWEGKERYPDQRFDEVESELERGWDKARAASKLTWQQAKHATRDAWERVEGAIPGDSDNDGK